jgi:hypothetical protein
MRLLPKDKSGKIEFCKVHLAAWAEHAAAIGTTPEQVAELATRTEAARLALIEQDQAQQAARAATLRLKIAIENMTSSASAIILQIRSEAGRGGDGVYLLAQISAPAKGSPIAPPGRPFGFKAELDAIGGLRLTWKCRNPRGSQGTIYQLWRRIDGGKLTYIGGTGRRRYVDATVPAGSAGVMYQIQAVRSTAKGDWATFNVVLGTRIRGKMLATMQIGASVKTIAA